MQAALPGLPLVAIASVATLPLAWLTSAWLEAGATWTLKLLLGGLLSLALMMLGQLGWRLVSRYRAKRRAKKELTVLKARLWNKLQGLKNPIVNSRTLCMENYHEQRDRIVGGQLEPLDVLEAFQARTLMLDEKGSKVREVVYDADLRAFLLDGKVSEVLMPAATFYYNAALAAQKERDEDGELVTRDHPVILGLRAEGAIDIGVVDKAIGQVSGLLLNHGAHFFAGQYPVSSMPDVLRAIASKPVCASLLSRDQPQGKFLALLACQPRLPSLAGAAVTPGMREHMLSLTAAAAPPTPTGYRVGFVFVHQRRSQAHGRTPPGEESVAELLSSPEIQSVSLVRNLPAYDRLLAASAKGDAAAVRAEVEAAMSTNSLDGLALVCGTDCRLAEQLAGFMDLSVYPLVEHLAELYLCHPHDKLRAGLAVAQAFGAAIRL